MIEQVLVVIERYIDRKAIYNFRYVYKFKKKWTDGRREMEKADLPK